MFPNNVIVENRSLDTCQQEDAVSINLKTYSTDYIFVVVSHGYDPNHKMESTPVLIRTPKDRKSENVIDNDDDVVDCIYILTSFLLGL